MPWPIACPEPSHAYAPKWASESRMQTLIGARLARESPATCRTHADSVHVAWPTVHGHSWVVHPGRSCLPGHNMSSMMVAMVVAWRRLLF